MFALTANDLNTRRLFFIICTLSACGSATWILGGDGESCLKACSNISQQCTESELLLHNGEVSSEGELSQLIESHHGNCTKYNAKYGRNSDVPAYQASTGECYVSASNREHKDFKCARPAPIGKQRLCWCHDASPPAKNANAVLNGHDSPSVAASADNHNALLHDNDGLNLSTSAIIWIISGIMLFLGLVGMSFGILRRIRKRSKGIPECAKERPADSGFYIRCPSCGCPIGESRSINSMGFGYSDGTKSRQADPVSYTHCPACACPLGVSRSVNSVEFDVTVSRQFRPGGSFLSEGSDSPMAKLKMADCCTPKSALRSCPKSASRSSLMQGRPTLSTTASDSFESGPAVQVEEIQEAVYSTV